MNSVEKRYINKKFSRLLVLSFAEYRKDETLKSGKTKKAAYYLCLCDCGNTKVIKGKYLLNGDTKSCGCLQPEVTITRNIKNRKLTSYFSNVWNSYRGRAKYKLLEFDLTKTEFKILTSSNCYYCGEIPLQKASKLTLHQGSFKNYKKEYYYNGLDRIDSSKGYIIDNVRPCCEICNKAKRNLSDDVFKNWLLKISNYQMNK